MDSDTNKIREKEVYQNLIGGKYPPADPSKASERWRPTRLEDDSARPLQVVGREQNHGAMADLLSRPRRRRRSIEADDFVTLQDFPNHGADTILIVEAGEAVPWPKPG